MRRYNRARRSKRHIERSAQMEDRYEAQNSVTIEIKYCVV
jgi:hypothetical protein